MNMLVVERNIQFLVLKSEKVQFREFKLFEETTVVEYKAVRTLALMKPMLLSKAVWTLTQLIEIGIQSRGMKLGGIEVQIQCFKLDLSTEVLKSP